MTHPPRHPLLALILLTACPAPADDPTALASSTSTTTLTTTTTTTPDPDPTTTTATTSTTTEADTSTTTTESTTTESTTTTTTSPPICGDGILDPDTEACDDGYGLNSDTAACTLHCQLNICGDALVHLGVEDCDHGLNNNDSPDNYGGCGTDCHFTSYCGDGLIQGAEECDFGRDNGSGNTEIGGVACDDTCRYAAKLCFLSSAVHEASALGSAAKADALCRSAALAAGYDNPNAFMAWVSDDASSPATRFTPSPIPFVLPNGRRIANHSKQLFTTGPLIGITRTDQGEDLSKARVWTGTAANGALFDPNLDCQNWTSKGFADQARIGRSGVDEDDQDEFNQWKSQHHWTSYKTVSCQYQFHLYCFEN